MYWCMICTHTLHRSNFTTKSREHNVSRSSSLLPDLKKRKKRLHSNLFCLPEDLNCLLSNPRAKTNASQIVSPLSVYTHSARLPSFLRFYITMTNCLTNIVGWITHVTFWIWKMCACESFHCRSAHAKDTS